MKIRANRPALADALTWVAQAINKKVSQPALAGIRLSADGGTLTMTAFDWDVAHTARLDVDVLTAGEVLVSGHALRSIVSALRAKEVELTVDAHLVTVSAGKSSYRVRTLPLDEFPTLPKMPKKVGVIDAADLIESLAIVRHPIVDDNQFDQIRGLRIEAKDGALEFVGLDQYHIAHVERSWSGRDVEITVHAKMFETAAKGMAGTVTIGQQDGVIGLADEHRAVTIRTYDASLFTPHWRKLVAGFKTPTATAEVDASALRDACKRTADFSDAAIVAFEIGDGEVSMRLADDAGEGSEALDAETTGSATAGMNARLLHESLSVVPSGLVRIEGHPADANHCWRLVPLDHPHISLAVMPRKAPTTGATR